MRVKNGTIESEVMRIFHKEKKPKKETLSLLKKLKTTSQKKNIILCIEPFID